MTRLQEILRKKLLAKIHMNEKFKEIKINDAWEDFLLYRFGVDSAKYLSIDELNKVLNELNNKIAWNGEKYEADLKGRAILTKNNPTQKQITQIFQLKADLGWSDDIFVRFVFKEIKVMLWNLNQLNSINKKKASTLIHSMTKICIWQFKKGLKN